jgi:cytochrome c-type biogenesis protein CcmH/NrfG
LEAQELNPSDARIGENLFKVQKDISNKVKDLDAEGVSLFEGGDKENAKSKFEEVLKFKPNDDTANDYVKRLTGQQAQAKVDAEKVKELYYEGVNLYINGKIHDAIGKWQECLKEDPNNVNAQSNINKAMVKLQSIEKLSQN